MATSKKKKKALRASFLVTVSATSAVMAMAALPGCGSNVSSSDDCPTTEPASGTSCGEEGLLCEYGDDGCGAANTATCTDGVWSVEYPDISCNPPFPYCPDEVPLEGSNCYDQEPGWSCDYPGDGGCIESYTATCSDDFTWQVQENVFSCNPPPCPSEVPTAGTPCDPTWEPVCAYPMESPCGTLLTNAICEGGSWIVSYESCNPPPPDLCYTLTNEADCAVQAPYCRWLTPGCGEPPLAQAGCFPADDCTDDLTCPAGTTCAERVTNPCYGLACDACGQINKLCVAP